MRKRNLLLPLFLGSLFITSNVHSSVFYLYEKQNNNLLIACGGGGGNSPKEKKEKKITQAERSLKFFESKKAAAEAKGESTEKIDKKIEKYKEILRKLNPKELKVQPTGEYGGIPVRIDYEKELKDQPTGEYGGIPVRIDYEEEIKGNKNNNSGNQQKKKPQNNKTDKKLLKEIVDERRQFIDAERKDPGITYYEKAKDKVSYLIKKTAASNPSPSDDFFKFTDKKYARLKELELIKNFIDIVVYEHVHSGKDFADYSLASNKKLPRKLKLRKEIYEKQHSLVSKINRKQYSEEIRILLYQLVEASRIIKFKMRGLYGAMSSYDDYKEFNR